MKLQDCLTGLFPALPCAELHKLEELLAPGWEESVSTFPPDWDALDPQVIEKQAALCQFREEVQPALRQALDVLHRTPELALLGWHCVQLLFDTPDYLRVREWVALTPELDRLQNGLSGSFFLWIALHTVPRLLEKNRLRGIPESITRVTLQDMGNMEQRYAHIHQGRAGISPKWSMNWLRTLSSGNLHRIGRLSYILRNFRGQVEAYRHHESGETLALSLPDLSCNHEGYLALTDEPVAWITSRSTAGSLLTGHPVHPCGKIESSPVTLDLNQWEKVLSHEDPVLEIHIPRNGVLNHQTTLQSFLEAKTFFRRYYPESAPKAYACYSWMLNPQLKDFLGAQSNLVAWQEEFYLFPFTSTGKDGLYFVFGEEDLDDSAPRDTRLRRAMLDHLTSGKRLRSGGMFFLVQDLPQYGHKTYQNPSVIND